MKMLPGISRIISMIAVLALMAECASMGGVAPSATPREANALATQRTLQDVHVADKAINLVRALGGGYELPPTIGALSR
ncbi:MAG TPA: hypothetical protein VFN86_05595 [Casimicrobiaceae bacterium]|nr:hypothetical protein [Casimicrobiaceae bacterium]